MKFSMLRVLHVEGHLLGQEELSVGLERSCQRGPLRGAAVLRTLSHGNASPTAAIAERGRWRQSARPRWPGWPSGGQMERESVVGGR